MSIEDHEAIGGRHGEAARGKAHPSAADALGAANGVGRDPAMAGRSESGPGMAAARLPPGPKGHVSVGSLPEFVHDRLGFLTMCARTYGDVALFRLGPTRFILLSHPEYIEHVLVTNRPHFIKFFLLRRNRLLLGNGLLTSDGDSWLRQRRLVEPALHADRVAAYGDLVVAAAQHMLASWPAGEARDLQAAMMRLTLEIMAGALFDVEVADDSDALGTALMTAIEAFIARMGSVLLLPERVPTPGNVRLRREVRRLNDLVYRLISQRRSSGAAGDDLLSQLLRAQDADGRRMTDRQVRDEVLTLFLGGHDTTAITLSWIWRLLGQHPEVEAALVAELQGVLDGRAPTVADLPRLRYTETIVYETLRLYPRVYILGREARQDCAIGGYRVPAGTTVLMSPWVMHRDPRYFERPEEFTPERWVDGLARGLPEYVYFPFGAGPRRCVGGPFAMMEAVLLVATIAQQVRLGLVPGPAHVLRSGPTLRPQDAVQVTLQRR